MFVIDSASTVLVGPELLKSMQFSFVQAAVDAKPESKAYQWRIIAPEAVVSRLLAIMEGCLGADASTRWTVEQVVDELSAVRGSLTLQAANGRGSTLRVASAVNFDHTATRTTVTSTTGSDAGMALSPSLPKRVLGLSSPVLTGTGTYDVIAVLDGLISVGVEDEVVASVEDAIGHLAVTSLGALKSCGVSGAKSLAARRLLAPRDDYPLVSGCSNLVFVSCPWLQVWHWQANSRLASEPDLPRAVELHLELVFVLVFDPISLPT